MILPRQRNTCPSTQIYHDDSYVAEVFAWTILGIVAFIARYVVRLRVLPLRKLQGDDWVGIAVLLFFIGLTGVKLTVYHFGTNSDYTEEAMRQLSQCQIDRIEFGSKLQVSAWYFYACFLWGLKAMILFLFSRLSLPPYQLHLFRIFSVVAALAFIAVLLTISFGCRPFSLNWGTLPYPPQRCVSRTQNFYTTSILNIVTDAAILSIALPLLCTLRVPLSRKIALTLLLCSGIFIISAALVAMLMSLLNADSTLNTNRWATREEIAGILAVNAPIIKPMFHWTFWRRDFDPHRARTRKPRKAARAPPAPVAGLSVVSEVSEIPPVKRIGVLSSVKSSFFTGSRSRDESKSGSGSGFSRQAKDCEGGKEIETVEVAWDGMGRDGNVVAYPPCVTRDGPQPIWPEPTHSWASRGDSLAVLELQAIEEEKSQRA